MDITTEKIQEQSITDRNNREEIGIKMWNEKLKQEIKNISEPRAKYLFDELQRIKNISDEELSK